VAVQVAVACEEPLAVHKDETGDADEILDADSLAFAFVHGHVQGTERMVSSAVVVAAEAAAAVTAAAAAAGDGGNTVRNAEAWGLHWSVHPQWGRSHQYYYSSDLIRKAQLEQRWACEQRHRGLGPGQQARSGQELGRHDGFATLSGARATPRNCSVAWHSETERFAWSTRLDSSGWGGSRRGCGTMTRDARV